MPTLKNTTALTAGRQHFCAIDDGKVKCWGQNHSGQANAPELKNPKLLTSLYDTSCALGDEGIKCWGEGALNEHIPSDLKNVRELVVSASYESDHSVTNACVLDDSGLKCWGSQPSYAPKDLKNPHSLNANGDTICAIDGINERCWGVFTSSAADVPREY